MKGIHINIIFINNTAEYLCEIHTVFTIELSSSLNIIQKKSIGKMYRCFISLFTSVNYGWCNHVKGIFVDADVVQANWLVPI